MISLAEQCDQRATEFQSGKPPAGEAGMMLCDGEWWKFWDGQRWFNGNSESIKKAWESVRNGQVVQFPVRRCRPATLPELLAAGLTEAEALPMLHKSMLLKDAQDDWGPWIPHKAGDRCPIVDDRRDGYEIRRRSGQEHGANGLSLAERDWGPAGNCIVGYRLKRTAKPPQAPAELWYPPQQEGFSEWRESSAYPDGIADKQVLVLLPHERKEQRLFNSNAYLYKDADHWSEIYVAYCIRIEADQPTSEQVEKCEPVTHLTPDEKADANEPMVERDFRPMSPRELLHHARRLPPEDKANETQEGPDGLLIDAAGASEKRLFVWGL